MKKRKEAQGWEKINNEDMEKGLGRGHQSKSGKMKNRSEPQKWKTPDYLCRS